MGRLESDGTASIFIDGVLLYSTSGGLPPTSNAFSIGGNLEYDNRGIEGQVDDLAIFDRALTDSEILSLKDGLISTIITQTPVDTNYVYDLQNQQLQTDGVKNYQYDANGNTISDGQRSYVYNQNNRMSHSTNGAQVTDYGYNYKGQRVSKSNSSETVHYIYDLQGLLIAEADSAGNIIKQYVYLNGQPHAQVIGNDVYYYHNSHLGMPQVMTDSLQSISWQASHTDFGLAAVATETIINNIRFPGQYFDAETGLHYNYFRDYDPEIGRYIQSDPIGLNGGINTYGYVGGNPVNYVDPTGEAAIVWPIIIGAERVYRVVRYGYTIGTILNPPPIYAPDRGNDVNFPPWTISSPQSMPGDLFKPWQNSETCEDDADGRLKDKPRDFMPGDKGADKWGRKYKGSAKEGRRRFHGIKWEDNMAGAKEDYWVNPETGDVIDPAGDFVGNLNDG